MKTDWIIVGAGLTGATFAERIASVRGESVLVIDQRDHVAGNAWEDFNAHGILEHKYGPHAFHTNSKEVWDYLSRFTGWRPYSHKVLVSIQGELLPLPFNLDGIDRLFPQELAQRLTEKLIASYGYDSHVPILKLREAEDAELRMLADFVYANVFEQYTLKQWGLRPEQLAPSVTARVPVRVSRDDRYFLDEYQAIPQPGYGAMVQRMLDHPNIQIKLGARWQDIRGQVEYGRMVFTGPVDEFFEFMHGELPYRSLRFESRTYPVERMQPAAGINYPNAHDYTRTTEHKWMTGQTHAQTTITTEYPLTHVNGQTIPYYPVPTEENRERCRLYEAEAEKLAGKVVFAGRLADYMYYNMDQAVARALSLFSKIE